MSKPLSLPGIFKNGPKCGSSSSSAVSWLCLASPLSRSARRPSAASRTSVGVPSAARSIGRQASRRRLASSLSLVSRLAFSASSRPGLAFLRLSPCEPITHKKPSESAKPSRSASSAASPGRSSNSASGKLWPSPKRSVSRCSGASVRRRSTAQASSPATHSQSSVKAAPERLLCTSAPGANSRRTLCGIKVFLDMGDLVGGGRELPGG